MKYPMQHRIIKPAVPYVRSESTNLAKTFARIRREQAEQEAAKPLNVRPLRKVEGK